MIWIKIDNKSPIVNTKYVLKDNFKNIMVLSEKDMKLENLLECLCSKDIDILIVPRKLLKEEEEIIYPYIQGKILKILE